MSSFVPGSFGLYSIRGPFGYTGVWSPRSGRGGGFLGSPHPTGCHPCGALDPVLPVQFKIFPIFRITLLSPIFGKFPGILELCLQFFRCVASGSPVGA